jgi:hypothetical protein
MSICSSFSSPYKMLRKVAKASGEEWWILTAAPRGCVGPERAP